MNEKDDPRAASERLERGIERYAEGELAAAAVEFEAALELCPGHERARSYLSWVRDVLQGKRGINGKRRPTVDEDALRAVAEALDLEDTKRAPSTGEVEWQPAQLTPSRAQGVLHSRPSTIPATVTPHETQSLAHKKTSSSTIVGMQPITRQAPTEDRPDSVTREWGGTPTGQNLPPLDVPELTEEQIAELISLESALPPSPAEKLQLVELEAEPTPPPHRIPSGTHRMPTPTETQPISLRPRSESPPEGLVLLPLATPADLDPIDIEPSRARSTLPSSPPPPAMPFAELTPPPPLPGTPLPGLAALDEPGSFPTDPLIEEKRLGNSYDINSNEEEDLELLPRAPDPPSAESAAERFAAAKKALAEGVSEAALELIESVVVESGGVEAETCAPYLPLLEEVYALVVGPLDRVPCHGEGRPDLDPRAAFLLSRVDGQMSAEDLLDISGMARLEALRLLALLIQYGAVVME